MMISQKFRDVLIKTYLAGAIGFLVALILGGLIPFGAAVIGGAIAAVILYISLPPLSEMR